MRESGIFSRLTDELQFVRLYLELQQRRFADRLTVVLPEPHEIYAVWVPSLILQPLVENAVVHGLAGHQGPVDRPRHRPSRERHAHSARDATPLPQNKPWASRRHRHQERARAARGAVRRTRQLHRRPGRHASGSARSPCRKFTTRPTARERRGTRQPLGRRMMNVIIVDDELAGRRTLREYCEAEDDLRWSASTATAWPRSQAIRVKRAAASVSRHPDGSAERHRPRARARRPTHLPSLVFVTAYDTYALEAFEVCAVDYLLEALRSGPLSQDARARAAAALPRAARTSARRCSPACWRNSSAARGRSRGAAAPAGRVQRPPARDRCDPGGDDRGGPKLRHHPRRPRQLSRAQHLEPGRTGAALAADAAHQPLLPGQHELCQGGEPHAARRLHPGARRAAPPSPAAKAFAPRSKNT